MIAKDLQPFSIVENSDFYNMINFWIPGSNHRFVYTYLKIYYNTKNSCLTNILTSAYCLISIYF